jgi:hypothetical protein
MLAFMSHFSNYGLVLIKSCLTQERMESQGEGGCKAVSAMRSTSKEEHGVR